MQLVVVFGSVGHNGTEEWAALHRAPYQYRVRLSAGFGWVRLNNKDACKRRVTMAREIELSRVPTASLAGKGKARRVELKVEHKHLTKPRAPP